MKRIPWLSRTSFFVRAMQTGLWFGIICGLIEGITQLTAQAFIDTKHVSIHILWVAPSLYGVVFSVVGGVIGLVGGRFPQKFSDRWLLFIMIFMTTLVPLAILLQGHAAVYAIVALALGVTLVIWRPLLQYLDAVFIFLSRSAVWLAFLVVTVAFLIPTAVQVRESLAVEALPEPKPDAPNVILLVVDTLRADHLSTQGYHRKTSPYLEELAQQGVLYERAYSTAPWTLPSHVSLLTGTGYDEHHIGWYNTQELWSHPSPVLPEVLQEHGYRTAAFSANVFFVTHDRLGRGFLHFDDYFFNFTDAVLRTMYGRAFEKYVLQRFGLEDIPARRYAEDINHALMDWVGNSPDRPFFALLNYIDVHDPYLPMEPYRSMFSPAGLLSGRINDRVGRGDPEMDDARLASEIDAYDGGIFYVDEQIRNLVNGLVKKKLMSDTILIITADHGESFGEHGLLLHGHSLYHEQLHVPLMFVWPGHIPENLRIGHPVTNASIAATVLDLIGVKNTLPGAASSLANWSAGDAEHSPVVAHTEKAEWVVERSPAYTGMLGSAFQGQWQLILHELESPQLFNLENDPRQQNNLSGQPDVQALEKSLSRPLNTPSLKLTLPP